MRWECIDSYGAQFAGESAAMDLEELKRDVRSMIEEVFREHQRVIFGVDASREEIVAPDVHNITHTLRVPLMGTLSNRGLSEQEIEHDVQCVITEALKAEGRTAEIQGPWHY